MGGSAVRIAASCAAALSLITILACVIMLPIIMNEVNSIREDLEIEIMEFSIMSKQIWSDISNLDEKTKSKRQAGRAWGARDYYAAPVRQDQPDGYGADVPVLKDVGQSCNCNPQNSCPPGPRGPKGLSGESGAPGEHGRDGLPGQDADSVLAQRQEYKTCFTCPRGMDGPQGTNGPPGKRGQRGARGKNGCDGLHGSPGLGGESGITGPPGDDGKIGKQGVKGNGTLLPVHSPGRKGLRGFMGDMGDKGYPGKDAAVGPEGDPGLEGEVGFQGYPGIEGDIGGVGKEGEPGKDAHYCPCPSRNYRRTSTTAEPYYPTPEQYTDAPYYQTQELPAPAPYAPGPPAPQPPAPSPYGNNAWQDSSNWGDEQVLYKQ